MPKLTRPGFDFVASAVTAGEINAPESRYGIVLAFMGAASMPTPERGTAFVPSAAVA